LLARVKSQQFLSLLMSALLAWPVYLPLVSRETNRPSRSEARVGIRPDGACFQRIERNSLLCQADWSDLADDSEESDGRDDFRFMPLAVAHRPLDLPSLIPSSLDTRPIGPVDPAASFLDFSPLRC
jgi:hypothetical protein